MYGTTAIERKGKIKVNEVCHAWALSTIPLFFILRNLIFSFILPAMSF